MSWAARRAVKRALKVVKVVKVEKVERDRETVVSQLNLPPSLKLMFPPVSQVN
jgi:hypothetical protein